MHKIKELLFEEEVFSIISHTAVWKISSLRLTATKF